LRLTKSLEKLLYKKPIIPTIIETTKQESLEELFKYVKSNLASEILKFPKQPAPSLPLVDRVMSRFQSSLSSLKKIKIFNMFSAPLLPRMIEDLSQEPNIRKLYPDRVMTILETVPSEGMYRHGREVITTTFWTKRILGLEKANEKGYTGKGIVISVIDTGYRPNPQLRNVEYYTTQREKGQFTDEVGHGVHVSTIACGKPYFDRTLNMQVEGMAPDSKLISIKALGFLIGAGMESDIIQAIQISIERRANIINMSLGSEEKVDDINEDAQLVAISKAVKYGIIPIVAAGNSGPEPETICIPGASPHAITIGAWDQFLGDVCSFSSKGPTPFGVKPDFVAPGYNIYSGCCGYLDMADKIKNLMAYLSGTSQATPHAAGLIACAMQMFKEHGVTLTTDMILDIGRKYGHEKSNATGYGLIKFDWFEEYLKTEIGI